MSTIVTCLFLIALLGACGCTTHKQTLKSALLTSTLYDTNAAARSVYVAFYKEAYRIAAAGRTNITYDYKGQHVHAATDGQWQGIRAGLQVVRERELQRLRRRPQLPKTTPYDGDPDARAAYLHGYRYNYTGALSGRDSISCFPQSRAAEAYSRGERDGEIKGMEDKFAAEKMWLDQYSQLSDCLARQQPVIRCCE